MSDTRPFKCGKCKNWYAPVPLDEPDHVCLLCLDNRHTPHPKTGEIDCHIVTGYRHMTATFSEIKMTETLEGVRGASVTVLAAVGAAKRAGTRDGAASALGGAETAFAEGERLQGQVAEYQTWAGVKEMPGTKGFANERRFKDISAIEGLVKNNRRPPEDLKVLNRSIKNCEAIATDITAAMSEVRIAIGAVREAAENWRATETGIDEEAKKQAAQERMARARAARKGKAPVAV